MIGSGKSGPTHLGYETTRRSIMTGLVGLATPILQRSEPEQAQLNESEHQSAEAILFRQAGGVKQSLQNKVGRIIDVDDFRFPGDADDTPAFARAVAELAEVGGEIRTDPMKRYTVSNSIVVSSLYHIAFTGANFGQVRDATGPGIAIIAPITSLFKVVAPRVRGAHGGVSFRSLSFYDATGGGGAPGRNVVSKALLDLRDACLSLVENCEFHFINGSIIQTDYFVQSSIIGCRVRYCGAAGKRVLHLGGVDTRHASQSVTIHDTRMEVCYGDAYLFIDSTCQAVTITACVFEAATTEYPRSNTIFIDADGNDYKIIGCSFNRNLARAVVLRGRGIVTACSFETGPTTAESLFILGARNVVSGNTFTDTRLVHSIRVVGVLNLLVGNYFFASGGIALEGAGNQFHNNVIDNPTMAGGGYCLVLADHCAAIGNHFNGNDFANNDFVPEVNGAVLYGANATFSHNSCHGWAGKTFIRVESTTASFQPNMHDGIGTFVTAGVMLNSVRAASKLVLPNGASVVTVTGAGTIEELATGLQWAGATVTLVFSNTAVLPGSANIKLVQPLTLQAGDTLTLASDGALWYETARSVRDGGMEIPHPRL